MNPPFNLEQLNKVKVCLPVLPSTTLPPEVPGVVQKSADPLKLPNKKLPGETFACKFCCKFFFSGAEKMEHEKAHVENKKLTCPICLMGFARRSYLSEHMCIHKGEQPHACYYCNKLFSLRCNLVRHVRIHTGEKPFKCNICHQGFTLKKNMIEHERIHTGERPFKCPRCEFAFSRRSSLVRHARIHTGEKVYQCHDCNKTFSWKYYLRRHVSTHLKKKIQSVRRRRTKEQIARDAAAAKLAQNEKMKMLMMNSNTEEQEMDNFRFTYSPKSSEPVSLPVDIMDIKIEESEEPCQPCTVLLPTDPEMENGDTYYEPYEGNDIMKIEPPDDVPLKPPIENHEVYIRPPEEMPLKLTVENQKIKNICPPSYVVLPPLRVESLMPRSKVDPLERSKNVNQANPVNVHSPSVKALPSHSHISRNEETVPLKFSMSRQEYNNFCKKKLIVELPPLPPEIPAAKYRITAPTDSQAT